MKNKNCILLFAAASVACLMAAGCKKTEFSSVESVPVKTVSISVTGDFNDFISEEGASKAFVENTFRMKWQDGDTVFVYGKAEGADAISCLGKLGATTVEDTDSRLADLTGDITAPGEDTKLTLVYSPGLIDTPELESGALSISLASQSGAADSVSFVAYATVDYLAGAEAAYRTAFNFATSILRVNATGLDADAALAQASLTNVETACILTIAADAAPAVSGDGLGTITRTFTEDDCANSKGNAAFYLALPAITANDNRALTVSQPDGGIGYLAYTYNGFAKGEAAAGRMLNSIATLDATDTDNYGNLSAAGTANCYIVSAAGNYKFDATVKGNATTPSLDPASASILWETFGNDVKPANGELVNNLELKDGSLCFSTTGLEGNALVAVKDAEDTILWSWHIWLTDVPLDQAFVDTLSEPVGTLMDRNLGATSAEPEDGALTVGLIYQWGRKDPFLTGHTYNVKQLAASTSSGWPSVPNDAQITLAETIQNPTSYCQGGNGWCSDCYYSELRILWSNGNNKTMYDPCPAGYRVMRNVYQPVFSANCVKDDSLHGFYVNMLAEGGSAWFPLGSWRHQANGLPYFNSEKAYIWTLGHNGGGCGKDNEIPLGGYEAPCASGRAVRCEKM